MTVSVAGNLILLGEYAVLEEGGRGITVAVAKHVQLEAVRSQKLSIESFWTGGSLRWTPERPAESALVSAAFSAARGWRLAHGREELPRLSIRVDSSELYSADGRKAGFGSSAAVTLALVAALCEGEEDPAYGTDHADGRLGHDLPLLALSAHRSAQGGAGSGYDVYCSYFGGWGLFCGGVSPTWKPCEPFGTRLYLFPGPAAVSTRDAIGSYMKWKSREPAAAGRLIEESNGNVEAFFSARNAREMVAAFRRCRDTGISFGEAVGVEPRLAVPPGVDPDLCKSVGAGNELGAYLRMPGALEPPAESGLTEMTVGAGISCTW